LYGGQHDKSIRAFQDAVNLNPDLYVVLAHIGFNYALKGMAEEAIVYVDSAMSFSGAENNHMMIGTVGWCYAKSGRPDKAINCLERLSEFTEYRTFDPIDVAMIYAGLGDKEKTFTWLNKAYADRSGLTIYLKTMSKSFFENVSNDPRYTELLRKIGFKE
jgi:tetratricopeptide (TPR) repeat protein